jgi:hypothetical protein
VEYTTAMEEGESALSLSDEYDGVRQWQFIDFIGAEPLGTFHAYRDLFNDGSVLLIDIAGATPGGLAVLVRLPHAPVFLCGNLAWTAEQARYVREPGFVFNRQSWWENAWRLKKFTELAPELVILPDNEWEAVEAAKTKDMILHPFPPVQEVKRPEKKRKENKPRKEKQQRGKKKQKAQAQKRSG